MNFFSDFVFDWFVHVFVPLVLVFFFILPMYVFDRKLKKKSFLLYHYTMLAYFTNLALILIILFRVSLVCEPLYEMLLPYLGSDTDRFCLFMQVLAILAGLSCCYYLYSQLRVRQISGGEVQVVGDDIVLCYLMYFLASFMFFYIDDFIMLYLVIELQSLSAYILAACLKNSSLSLEAGIKYFILGSLASGLILFGIALVYGYTGAIDFISIQLLLLNVVNIPTIYLVGLSFILSGLFFKLGLFPFHAWLPDVYSGSPFFITAIFATVPKLPLVFFLVKFFLDFIFLFPVSSFAVLLNVCSLFSLFSVIFGIFGAFYQITLQRLVAYSSIANIGYVGFALFTSSAAGFYSALFFTSIYIILMLNFFWLIFLFLNKNGAYFYYISDLYFIGRYNPIAGHFLGMVLFSLAGVPPLAGFFSKISVFNALLAAGSFFYVFFVALLSSCSALYYIRLVRVMFFDRVLLSKFRIFSSYFGKFSASFFTFFNIFFMLLLDFFHFIFFIFLV